MTNPCPDALVGTMRQTLNEPLTMPRCRTNVQGRPVFNDGAPRTWLDEQLQVTRAACVFVPAGTQPLPLVLYLHGSGGSADAVYDSTSLRSKATTFRLGPPGGAAGFVLAANQGLNQENLNGNPPASRHMVDLRDFSAASRNPDVRALDTLIDTLVAEGRVDPRRIYLTGWSNGGAFSQAYGLARASTPTAGGNRVAAVAVFDAPNPAAPPLEELAACRWTTLPDSSLHVFHVHRDCSIAPCNRAQALSQMLPAELNVAAWTPRLRAATTGTVVDIIIDRNAQVVTTCVPVSGCGELLQLTNHVRWPDGVADSSGIDFELQMLQFLADHPRP